jgi:GNAT superfamily N-acetyltransferase
MRILEFAPAMAADLARCYSDLVAPAPHCHPVGEERFSDLKKLADPRCREEALLAARDEGGNTVAFVHLGIGPPPSGEQRLQGDLGIIRFLSYTPGQRRAGKALLDAAEDWARDRGCREIIAGQQSYMYPFHHLPFGHISEQIAHLPPLFAMEGYSVFWSSVFFDWPDFEPPRVPKPDMHLELVHEERQIETLGPGVAVYGEQGGRRVGACEIAGLGHDSWRPWLRGWCFCTDLHVDEPLQGKGLGKYLLASGLAAMRRAGYRHAIVSTNVSNCRAQLLYSNFGFRFLDRTVAFKKELVK